MKRLMTFALTGFVFPLFAATYVVDPKAPAGAQGTFPTIQKAVSAAGAGDVITVKGGVYRECIGFDKSYEGAPLTLKAASGERVIITGFEKITGWKDEGGGVYSAHTTSAVAGFFVGYVPQQCARWPHDGVRLPIRGIDDASRKFKTDAPKDAPELAALAKDPKSAIAFCYVARGNYFSSVPFASYDPATGDIGFDEGHWTKGRKPDGDGYSFMNHPALIKDAGNWAFVADAKGDKKNTAGTVYFKPADKADLDNAFYREAGRPLINIGHWKNRVGNIVVDGFEVTGSGTDGIKVGGDDVTVQNCIAHHNRGHGIAVRGAKNITVCNNISLANYVGIAYASVEKGLIEGNEIAHNLMDGLVVAGNISGRKTGEPGANPPTRDIVVRRNYLHHHFIMGHPDNFQMYRDVFNTRIEENFDVWGGQSLMAEEVEDVEFCGNVFMGCEAVMVICGHGNSNRWNFRNNTFWGAGYGFFSFTGHDYLVEGNLFVGGSMPYGSPDAKVVSRKNFFSPSYVGKTAKPWRTYTDFAKAGSEIGQEEGSRQGDAGLANFPSGLVIAHANGHATDSLALRGKTPDGVFAAGDKIELNGDGKLRTVVSCANGVVTFKPGLEIPPFRGVMIANWKAAPSVLIDNRAKGDAGFGAKISTVDFAAGDLLGKGTRTLPTLPADVQAAMPDPNKVIVPPSGS